MTDSKVNYTATFVLKQEGEDGEIHSTLTFDPLPTEQEIARGSVPDAYEIMSHLAEHYLFIAGVIDEDGDLIDPEALDNATFNVRESFNKGHLN